MSDVELSPHGDVRVSAGPEDAAPAREPVRRRPRPLAALTSVLRGLYLVAAVQAYALAAAWLMVLLQALGESEEGVNTWVRIVGIVGLVGLPVLLLTGPLFLAWSYRAQRNLWVLNVRDVRYRPGWAFGAWFVPLANLVLPMRVVEDLWHGSRRLMNPFDRGPAGPVTLVRRWWYRALTATFLPFLAAVVIAGAAESESRDGARFGLFLIAVACVVSASSATAARAVVSEIAEMRHRRVSAATST